MDLFTIILLSLFAGVVSLIGGIVFLKSERLSNILEKYAVAIAAGVLLTISVVGLLPESVELIGQRAYVLVLASFVGAYLFENLVFRLHHHASSGRKSKIKQQSVALVIVGDTLHNFIDGATLAASYLVSPSLGVLSALTTFLHEVPHEIGDFGILLRAGWEKRKILLVNIISSLFTLAGALLVYFTFQGTVFLGVLLSVSAGIFLYLATTDFLPDMQMSEDNEMEIAALLIGSAVMLLLLFLTPHAHVH